MHPLLLLLLLLLLAVDAYIDPDIIAAAIAVTPAVAEVPNKHVETES